jgi:hypothetical protein
MEKTSAGDANDAKADALVILFLTRYLRGIVEIRGIERRQRDVETETAAVGGRRKSNVGLGTLRRTVKPRMSAQTTAARR